MSIISRFDSAGKLKYDRVYMRKLFVGFVVFLVITGCSERSASEDGDPTESAQNSAASVENLRPFVIADLSDEPAKKIDRLLPLADYVAEQLKDTEITSGNVIVASDPETIREWLSTGEADIYMDSVYPALLTAEGSKAKPILKRWKDGAESYSSVVFVKDTSHFRSIEDLHGAVVAFEEPFSTSGYMLPLGSLLSDGYRLQALDDIASVRPSDAISWLFAGEDENVIHWVLNERTEAGVLGSSDFDDLPEETRGGLRIIYETVEVPRQIVLLRSGFAPSMEEQIIDILTSMESSEEGLKVLDHIKHTTRFERLDESEIETVFSFLQALRETVEPLGP